MFKTYRTFDLRTGVKSKALAVINLGKNLAVILHQTVVLRTAGKSIILDNGGWDTQSTRIVINQALNCLGVGPFYLFRSKGETLIQYPDGSRKPFTRGMRLSMNQGKVA